MAYLKSSRQRKCFLSLFQEFCLWKNVCSLALSVCVCTCPCAYVCWHACVSHIGENLCGGQKFQGLFSKCCLRKSLVLTWNLSKWAGCLASEPQKWPVYLHRAEFTVPPFHALLWWWFLLLLKWVVSSLVSILAGELYPHPLSSTWLVFAYWTSWWPLFVIFLCQ